ncbi:hypothetical protein LSAT2_005040 [Lamellibrachia satsuma]|nr:hypothetical protein LSAT2_005040 [Lamellibrachia satsuma]
MIKKLFQFIFAFEIKLRPRDKNRLTVSASTETQKQQHDYYKVKPAVLGIEVFGIKLNDPVPQEAIDQIKKDVQKYRIVIFRDQGQVSGKRQAEIGKWFGELDSPFNHHPMSPDHDVLRLSNDEAEGFRGLGYQGFHIEGSHRPMPYPYVLYHMYHVPKRAATVFAPMREVIEGLSKEQLKRWERLWMTTILQTNVVHPVIYSHPATDEKTLCFHLSTAFLKHFIWDYGTPVARITDHNETAAILREIEHEFTKDGAIQYSHKANILEISEQIGAPEVSCAWPTGEWIRPDSHHSNPQL